MLRFLRNGQEIFSFGDTGAFNTPVLVKNQSVNRIQSGELNIFCNGLPVLETGVNAQGVRELHIRGNHFPQGTSETAIIPLRLLAPGGAAVASISYSGGLIHTGTFSGSSVTATAVQPYKPGSYTISGGGTLTYKTFTYGSKVAGVPRFFNPDGRPAFSDFLNPSPGFEIGRTINVGGFIEPGVMVDWQGFRYDLAPLFGYISVPDGAGPYPVVVFVHGLQSDATVNSAKGFVYLCEHLASLGIIGITVSTDFLNRAAFPGKKVGDQTIYPSTYTTYSRIGGRMFVMFEHLRQLGIWNSTPGHPLYKRVDMSRIMLMGHSQGGETIYYAGYYNKQARVRYATMYPDESAATDISKREMCDLSQFPAFPANRIREVWFKNMTGLRSYCFHLRSLFFLGSVGNIFKHIAPDATATFTRPVYAMENMVMYGAQDNDSNMYEGFCIKSRLTTPDKAYALCVQKTNHNYFNSAWLKDDSNEDGRNVMTYEQHRQILKSILAAFALKTLHAQTQLHGGLQQARLFLQSNQLPAGTHYMNYNVPVNSQDIMRSVYNNTSNGQWMFSCLSVGGNINGNFNVYTSRDKSNKLTHLALDSKYFLQATFATTEARLDFQLQSVVSLASVASIELVLFMTNASFSEGRTEDYNTLPFNLELKDGQTSVSLPAALTPLPMQLPADKFLKETCLLPVTYRFDMNEFRKRGIASCNSISLVNKANGPAYFLIHEIRLVS